MRKILLSLNLLFVSFCLLAQSTIIIDGKNIDLDKIPFNKAYKVTLNKNSKLIEPGKTIRNQKIFASDNKEYIAIGNTYSYNSDYKGEDKYKGDLKVYNLKGDLIWEFNKKSHYIINCYIGDDAGIVHAIWYFDSDIPDGYKLESYDKTGQRIFQYNTSAIYSSGNRRKIFFLYEEAFPNVKLVYKNFINGESWIEGFSSNVKSVYDFTSNCDRILIKSDNLLCVGENSEIIWEKNISAYSASLSDNGDKILNLIQPGHIQLSSIENNNVLFEKNNFSGINPKFKPTKCTFIENTDDYYMLSGVIGPLKTLVVIFDNSNKIIKKITIEEPLWVNLDAIKSDSTIDIYFDGLKVYSF